MSKLINILILLLSVIFLIKTSSVPLLPYGPWNIFEQFKYANDELFSISASIIAAYIFYLVNTFLPYYFNRKKAIKVIGQNLTQVIYRCVGLSYVYDNIAKNIDEKTLKRIYRIISDDLDRKLTSIEQFAEFLSLRERKALYTIGCFRDKFRLSQRNLDSINAKLKHSAFEIVDSIKLEPAHADDSSSFQRKGDELYFDYKSRAYLLFLVELIQFMEEDPSLDEYVSNLKLKIVELSRTEN
ncbi:hypothetical protein [Photobacterium kishitanii]|uniref:hypothetical protein n=1 Tax=Photobacterium kishitanii TaxID=318456 RepID=UPI0011B1E8FC|nr:hypothetical protein [Photobacterium kishitanii]